MLRADTIEVRRTALESLAKFGPKASSAIPALINLVEGMKAVPARVRRRRIWSSRSSKRSRKSAKATTPLLVEALVRMLKPKGFPTDGSGGRLGDSQPAAKRRWSPPLSLQ